jgi:hypothetical protein
MGKSSRFSIYKRKDPLRLSNFKNKKSAIFEKRIHGIAHIIGNAQESEKGF